MVPHVHNLGPIGPLDSHFTSLCVICWVYFHILLLYTCIIHIKQFIIWYLQEKWIFIISQLFLSQRKFLVHLSRRLKCTIVIMRCPSSFRRPSFVNFFTFSTSPLKPLNRIQQNLTGSKISMSSTKFVFFRPIGKTRWPPRPLIGWDIFDFSSETAEQNSAKLDRKQGLNFL